MSELIEYNTKLKQKSFAQVLPYTIKYLRALAFSRTSLPNPTSLSFCQYFCLQIVQ